MRKAGTATSNDPYGRGLRRPVLGTESLVRKADVADKSFEAFCRRPASMFPG